MPNSYKMHTIEGQMNLLLNAIGNVSDKLKHARDNKLIDDMNH